MKKRTGLLAAIVALDIGLLWACGSSSESRDGGDSGVGMSQLPPTIDASAIVELVDSQLSNWLNAIPER